MNWASSYAAFCDRDQSTIGETKEGHTSAPMTTHSSTCRAVKCHCCVCSLSTEEAPWRWQMSLIVLDGNWWGKEGHSTEGFLLEVVASRANWCTCGLASHQPLWKLTVFISLRKDFSTSEICILFGGYAKRKLPRKKQKKVKSLCLAWSFRFLSFFFFSQNWLLMP